MIANGMKVGSELLPGHFQNGPYWNLSAFVYAHYYPFNPSGCCVLSSKRGITGTAPSVQMPGGLSIADEISGNTITGIKIIHLRYLPALNCTLIKPN